MFRRTPLMAVLAALTTPVLLLNSILIAQAADPIAPVGALVAVNVQKDKCFDKINGTLVEVKCPDVIVAKPSPSSGRAGITPQMVAQKARAGQFVPRQQVKRLGTQVPLSRGTYNCYKEGPAGHFTPIRCPDVIVLETN